MNLRMLWYHNAIEGVVGGRLPRAVSQCGARISDGDGIEYGDVTQDGEPRDWRRLGAGEGVHRMTCGNTEKSDMPSNTIC
jgi:hypothetical protein